MTKKKVKKTDEVKEEPKSEVIEEVKAPEIVKEIKNPVTYQEHIDAGFISGTSSESLQKSGKKVVEIKNVEGKLLHRLE